MIKERSIGVGILLSIVTCGIYGLYWFACVTEDMNRVTHEDSPSGVLALILSIITCGIYNFYWAYIMGERVDKLDEIRNGTCNRSNTGLLYLILNFVAPIIIVTALLQNELNKVSDINA